MLATKAFIVHSLITILGLSWSLFIEQLWLVAAFGVLWLATLVIYFESTEDEWSDD